MRSAIIAARRHVRSMAAAMLAGSGARGLIAVALFTAVQIADGILTFQGVGRFGLQMESNPLLALSIAAVGAGLTLSIAKTIAVLLGTMLHRRQCHGALAALTMFYVVAAVLPWTAALV